MSASVGGLVTLWRLARAAIMRIVSLPAGYIRREPRSGWPHPGRRDVIQMAATITLTYPFSTDDIELLHKLLGTQSGDSTPPAPGVSAAPAASPVPAATIARAAPAPAVDHFPADPGEAPFPSPENSQIIVLGSKVSGRPYLKDSLGRIHQLKMNAAGAPEYWMNGISLMEGWSNHANGPPAQLLVRQGGVYVFLTTGATQVVREGGGIYNATVPPAWTTTASNGTPVPAASSLPTASGVAPGSSGRVIECGIGHSIQTLSAAIATAKAGDKIQLSPGIYRDTPPPWEVPLLIDLGGATFDASGRTATLARGKALLCPTADSIIQNGTIINVAMDQGDGQLTSAIRPDVGCGYLTIHKMKLTENQCGIGHGGFPIVITVSDSDISGNGLKVNRGALTHNLYVGIDCRRLTLTNVIANGTSEAHSIKYRGPELIVNGGTFASAPGKPFDLPNGSTVPFKITGATIIKGANDADHGVISYATEGTDNGLAGGTINRGAIQANCNNPFIVGAGGTITASGVAISGNKITGQGGVVLVGV
jgi:hypothetical protein